MISNQPPLFHNGHDDDGLTVQISEGNSHLGQLLLEADWSELQSHLATPDGQCDVEAKNDPLGLFNAKKTAYKVPPSKNTALFAALFVRAPYTVIEKIYTMAPSHVDEPLDMMYVLSVIPSEEEARLQDSSSTTTARKNPYRTRAWTSEEYAKVLNLLLHSFISSMAPSSALLKTTPSWMLPFALTPLAIAAYNPDVPAVIVEHLCALQPEAIEKECKFFGITHATPLIIAAASPLPTSKEDSKYNEAKDVRWEKIKLSTLPEAWYDKQREVLIESVEAGEKGTGTAIQPLATATTSPHPEPKLEHIEYACEEAKRRNEWELVREFLKRYNSSGDSSAVSETAKEEPSKLDLLHIALTQHDEKTRTHTERKRESQEKARTRDKWLHDNMGLVMYPVDAALDLVSAVIPKKKSDAGGIVHPMS